MLQDVIDGFKSHYVVWKSEQKKEQEMQAQIV